MDKDIRFYGKSNRRKNHLTEQQYDKITQMLEEAKDQEMNHTIKHLANLLNGVEHDSSNEQSEDQVWLIVCFALRVKVALEMMSLGDNRYEQQCREDIDKLIHEIGTFTYTYENKQAISDTLDFLLALSPAYKAELFALLPTEYLDCQLAEKSNPLLLSNLFCESARLMYQRGLKEEALSLLKEFLVLSRNRNEQQIHREIVAQNVLATYCEENPRFAIQIGEQEADCFKNIFDMNASVFYWFYGYALRHEAQFDSAKRVFKKSWEIRKNILGTGCWSTDFIESQYDLIRVLTENNPECEKRLLRFIDQIEAGNYSELNQELLHAVEGELLYQILSAQTNKCMCSYEAYLNLYELRCEEFNIFPQYPLIKKRLAKTMRGIFFVEQGNYILAEQAFTEAIAEELPEGTPEIISIVQLKCNLLLSYLAQNDVDLVITLCDELLAFINNEDSSDVSTADFYRFYGFYVALFNQFLIGYDEEMLTRIKELIKDAEDFIKKENCSEAAVFIIVAISCLLGTGSLEKAACVPYYNLLCRIEEKQRDFGLVATQQVTLYISLSILASVLQLPNEKQYVQTCLQASQIPGIPYNFKARALYMAAQLSAKNGDQTTANKYLNEEMCMIEQEWHTYVYYANDTRLLFCLLPAQNSFTIAYPTIRKNQGVWDSYEKILRFKALASLAGKERNQILRNTTIIDQELLRNIHALQNELAVYETANWMASQDAKIASLETRLRTLEAEFAARFPKIDSFTSITTQRVLDAIPNEAVVLEFYGCAQYYELTEEELAPDKMYDLDVFIIQKRNGDCTLQKITLYNGQLIMKQAEEFIALLQAESQNNIQSDHSIRKSALSHELYEELLQPIEGYISSFETVYIAPDDSLINLPFEILQDQNGKRLEDQHTIIKLECARDFLFGAGRSDANGSLIIGNPQYEIWDRKLFHNKKKQNTHSERVWPLTPDSITPLPFTEQEVRYAAAYCNTTYYTGKYATKQLLMNAKEMKNIHIATHGFFDLSGESDVLYSSCLLFAGAKNWIARNESTSYGNGIVTADEISRLDLHSVELVVLSSCMSGMNEIVGTKGFEGLIGAFSATGVQYVVAHLWAANDFTAAILMSAFYYYYGKRHFSPPVALRMAKRYLRTVTIGQLKESGWFSYALNNSEVDELTKETIRRYSRQKDSIIPFRSEAYWGGFSCYQCNH